MINKLKLIIALVICQLAGLIGSLFNRASLEKWYPFLNKPSFNPPNWVFMPVWITLFVLMGISFYLIWSKRYINKKAYNWFIIQLILNVLWSAFFFGLRNPLLAFFEIIVLWIFILLTIIEFYRVDKVAGYLLIPYIVWVSFAAILNLSIVILN